MPITFTHYGCQFKCGLPHKSNPKKVAEHEKSCWYNPEVKSCLTCEHGEIFSEDGSSYRICLSNDNDIEFDGIKPKVNCSSWESKDY